MALLSHVRLFRSLAGYRRDWLSRDFVAGATVWAVLVPEALAYASLAGVSPVVGLYAAPGALLMYAAFGSSRHLIVGPMSATAALSAATVAQYAAPGDEAYLVLTTALAIVAGIIAIVAGIIRLGFVSHFISDPVLKGFIIGLALTIIASQLPRLLGLDRVSGNFFQIMTAVIENLGDIDPETAFIGIVSLFVVLGLRHGAPLVPGALVAVILGSAAVALFNLDDDGVVIVGNIEGGLPSFGLPDVAARSDYFQLAAGGAAIVLVAFAEGLAAAKKYAERDGYKISTNDELVGLGAANLAAGISGGMVVNGSLTKTAVNGSSGAMTEASGLVAAGLTVLTLLFLTGLFEQLPEATLAAIVISALIEVVDIQVMVHLYRMRSTTLGRVLGPAARADFLAASAALFGVLIFDLLPGLFIGIATSMILLLYRASRPRIAHLSRVPGTEQFADSELYPGNEEVPGLAIIRIEAGLFFANAETIREEVERIASVDEVHGVLIDAEAIPFVDVSAAEMLDSLSITMQREGKQLLLAHETGQVKELVSLAAAGAPLESFGSIEEAVRYFAKGNGDSSA
jgi:SulP family sulfate permease